MTEPIPATAGKLSNGGADVGSAPVELPSDRRALAVLAPFQTPVLRASLIQMATTFLPYFGLIVAMYFLARSMPYVALALAVPTAFLVVRIFIIQHDCGHGAYFRSRRLNVALGTLCSVITMTPFANWRRQHANHHAMWNNLDQRDSGSDIYSTCLTVREYASLSPVKQWLYRAVRHPLIAQLILPPVVFVLLYRIPFDTPRAWRRERMSVLATDAALVALIGGLMFAVGVTPVLLVQLPVIMIAAIVGVWLFSVQHRFEDAQWTRDGDWTPIGAALHGSSYLRLPAALHWMTGNIGFHHIHHLLPRVPNYRLRRCHRACPDVTNQATAISLWQAFRAPSFALWDEERSRMVRFRDVPHAA